MSNTGLVQAVDTPAITLRSAQPSEVDAVVAMFREHAASGDALARFAATIVRHDPNFRAEHLRIAEVEGQLAGALLVLDRVVRLGSAQTRCAVIAPVTVARKYRSQALASSLTRDALRYAHAQGCHLALLWGHLSLYPGLGFAQALKGYRVVLPAGLKPVEATGYVVRPATRSDAPDLARCYHQSTAATTLAEIRTDAAWQWLPTDDQQVVEVVVDPLGSVRGYFRGPRDDGRLDIAEIAILDDGAAPALSDRLLRLAAGATVHVTATPDNKWSRWAFARGASYVVTGGHQHGMVRVLDLRRWLDAVLPELQRRVDRSEYCRKDGRLRIETPLGSLGLRIARGRLSVDHGDGAALVTLPSSAFGSLVVGYRSAESLVDQPGVRIEGEHTLRLLDLLFPEGYPHWSPPAYF